MTQPTTPNATTGKSIYLDGFVLEDVNDIAGKEIYVPGNNFTKILCPLPHNFTNYQPVVEGKDYVKQHEVCTSYNNTNEWIPISKILYGSYNPQSRRIIALPIQNDNKEGEKDIKTDWLEKKKLFDEIEQRLINKVTSMDDIELLDIFNEWMNLRNGLNTNWIEYIKQKLNNITNK